VTQQGRYVDHARKSGLLHESKSPKQSGHAAAGAELALPPTVETFSAADLLAMDLPDTCWAVGGILPEGLSILAGKPKLGKSWLALLLAIAVATAGVALGKIKVEAGEVLYLALEDTKRRLKNRLEKLLGRQDAAAPKRLTLARDWPRADRGGLAALEKWLSEHKKARLVVVDTWAKFRPVHLVRGNEYERDYQDGGELKAVADRYGVAILVLHHCRKMGAVDPLEEVSGTLGLTGVADAVLVLRRERGQHDAALCVTGRDVEEQELALRWDGEFCLWEIVGEAEEYRMSKERAEVLQILREAGRPLKPSEAAPLLGKQVPATRKLLWTMEQAGQLRSIDGAYVSGNHSNPSLFSNRGNRG
jgi:hypothetical protein